MYCFLEKRVVLKWAALFVFYYGHSVSDWKVVYQEKYATNER
jgi:hypothetical protein